MNELVTRGQGDCRGVGEGLQPGEPPLSTKDAVIVDFSVSTGRVVTVDCPFYVPFENCLAPTEVGKLPTNQCIFAALEKAETISPKISCETPLGMLVVDREKRKIEVLPGANGEDTLPTLTKREMGILECLISNQGRVASYQILSNALALRSDFLNHKLIKVHISRIRSKLGDSRDLVVTVPNLGYMVEKVKPEKK